MNLQYRPLGGNECVGSLGAYGVRIEAASSEKFDPEDSRIQQAVWEALKLVEGAVKEAAISVNPKEQDRARQERAQLLILFPQPIYVETIPNGYCNEACCKHLPWFVVTLSVPLALPPPPSRVRRGAPSPYPTLPATPIEWPYQSLFCLGPLPLSSFSALRRGRP